VGRSAAGAAVGVAETVAKGWRIEGRGIVDHHKSRSKSEQDIEKDQEKYSSNSLPSFWG
jgi:hypothetical protein